MDNTELNKHLKRQMEIIEHFWSRWKSKYLTTLCEYHRSSGRKEQLINVGDIVQVHDESKRINWKLALVKELIKGNVELLRAVKIKKSIGETTRPIVKLFPLEINKSVKKYDDAR